MSPYRPPVSDMMDMLRSAARLDGVLALPAFAEFDEELVESVLHEAARLSADEIAPHDAAWDKQGARLENGAVVTADGMGAAYGRFVEGEWNGLSADPAFGGQGLPHVVGMAVQEMWHGASMAFGLCPLLTQGVTEALHAHGSAEQKAVYLPKLVTGQWTGTMNMTEPQAGTDLGAIRTRAWREGSHYRLKGQKIFISYGEHDLAENIVHMVLARIDGAPEGSRGLSLFIVPKFVPAQDGSPGQRNDLRPVSLEHKLGIHASPTCTMAYGDQDGAIGFLVGQENEGLALMFTMMNHARINVGLEGVGVAERAFQRARAYAGERVQGRGPDGGPATIDRHPDVRRMLLSMRARTMATRALAYAAGAALDRAWHGADEASRTKASQQADVLTPLVKGWCTDMAVEVATTGIQVHGGMGFIEETGAAQHLRDVRITQIYEGTNGVQAGDLVFRKLARDGGAAVARLTEDLAAWMPQAAQQALSRATSHVADRAKRSPSDAAAIAVPYQSLLASVVAGALLTRAAEEAGTAALGQAAAFFDRHVLTGAPGLAETVLTGHESLAYGDGDAL